MNKSKKMSAGGRLMGTLLNRLPVDLARRKAKTLFCLCLYFQPIAWLKMAGRPCPAPGAWNISRHPNACKVSGLQIIICRHENCQLRKKPLSRRLSRCNMLILCGGSGSTTIF
jgi:hypothetical protein